MSVTTLSAPGSESGPCLNPCEHADCQQIRTTAQKSCPYCLADIGYEREIILLPDHSLVHADCFAIAQSYVGRSLAQLRKAILDNYNFIWLSRNRLEDILAVEEAHKEIAQLEIAVRIRKKVEVDNG